MAASDGSREIEDAAIQQAPHRPKFGPAAAGSHTYYPDIIIRKGRHVADADMTQNGSGRKMEASAGRRRGMGEAEARPNPI